MCGRFAVREIDRVAWADWERWLACGADGAGLMRPVPDERVEIREIGPSVGNVRNDGPELVVPLGAG